MKNQTQSYIEKEQAVELKPVELFHFWKADGSQHWRYTSHDEDVEYQGNTYQAATLRSPPFKFLPFSRTTRWRSTWRRTRLRLYGPK